MSLSNAEAAIGKIATNDPSYTDTYVRLVFFLFVLSHTAKHALPVLLNCNLAHSAFYASGNSTRDFTFKLNVPFCRASQRRRFQGQYQKEDHAEPGTSAENCRRAGGKHQAQETEVCDPHTPTTAPPPINDSQEFLAPASSLEDNVIGQAGAEVIADALSKNEALEELECVLTPASTARTSLLSHCSLCIAYTLICSVCGATPLGLREQLLSQTAWRPTPI